MTYIKFSVDVMLQIQKLPYREQAVLMQNLTEYAVTGKEPLIENYTDAILFGLFKEDVVDRQKDISNKRKVARKQRERENKKAKETETKKERSKEKRKEKEKEKTIEKERGGTSPALRTTEAAAPQAPTPTRREIIDFCREEGYAVDADRFYDYYSSNGWRRAGGRISDWKALVRYWESVDSEKRPRSSDSGGSFDTDEFYAAALERVYGDLPKV